MKPTLFLLFSSFVKSGMSIVFSMMCITVISQTSTCYPNNFILKLDGLGNETKNYINAPLSQTGTVNFEVHFQFNARKRSENGNLITYNLFLANPGTLRDSERLVSTLSNFSTTRTFTTALTITADASTLVGTVTINTTTGDWSSFNFQLDDRPISPSTPVLYRIVGTWPILKAQIALPSPWVNWDDNYTFRQGGLTGIGDSIPPVAICRDITVYLPNSSPVLISADSIGGMSYDNCSNVTLDISPKSVNCDDLGKKVTVQLTATDKRGNHSNCTAKVSVKGVKLHFYMNNRFIENKFFNLSEPCPSFAILIPKICADGSQKTTYIHVYGAEGINLKLNIKNSDPNAPDIWGSFEYEPNLSNNEKQVFRYIHPTGVYDPSGNPKTDQFNHYFVQVIDLTKNQVLLETPMRIYRAPVVMLHGIWANGSNTFGEMSNNLIQSGQWLPSLLYAHSYPNSASFEQNRLAAFNASRITLQQANRNDFSASRVNLVAHSMGGLLTRKFIQSSLYQNDICRFITANTPHSGSHMANLLEEDLLLSCPVIGRILYNSDHDPYSGAVHDLRVDGKELADLFGGINGINNLNLGKAPSHTIVTIGDEQFMTPIIDLLLKGFIEPFGLGPLYPYFKDNIFQDDHDWIVAKESQQGGFSKSSTVLNQAHVGSTANATIINRVKQLFNANPKGELFSSGGFNPPKLVYFYHPAHCSSLGSGNVTITNPTLGSIVASGSTVNISVSGRGNVSKNLFFAGNNDIERFSQEQASQSATYTYRIPLNAYGKINLVDVGFDANGFIAYDTSFIIARPAASISNIFSISDTLVVPVGGLVLAPLMGFFSDSITRTLTDATEVSFRMSDTLRAKFIKQGVIKGVSIGKATAYLIFRNDTVKVNIIVLPASTVSETKDVLTQSLNNNRLLVQNYPNPFGKSTNIPYFLPQNAHVKIAIYSLMGHKVITLFDGKQLQGKWATTWDGKNEDGILVPEGIYFCRLSLDNQKQEVIKMVLLDQ